MVVFVFVVDCRAAGSVVVGVAVGGKEKNDDDEREDLFFGGRGNAVSKMTDWSRVGECWQRRTTHTVVAVSNGGTATTLKQPFRD